MVVSDPLIEDNTTVEPVYNGTGLSGCYKEFNRGQY